MHILEAVNVNCSNYLMLNWDWILCLWAVHYKVIIILCVCVYDRKRLRTFIMCVCVYVWVYACLTSIQSRCCAYWMLPDKDTCTLTLSSSITKNHFVLLRPVSLLSMVDPAKLYMIDPLYLVVFTPILDNKNTFWLYWVVQCGLQEKREMPCVLKMYIQWFILITMVQRLVWNSLKTNNKQNELQIHVGFFGQIVRNKTIFSKVKYPFKWRQANFIRSQMKLGTIRGRPGLHLPLLPHCELTSIHQHI